MSASASGSAVQLDGERILGLDGMSYYDLAAELERGGRFVRFEYCISLIVVTLRRSTAIRFVRAGQSAAAFAAAPTLTSLLLGWWGIPSGPVHTAGAICRNLAGGRDVTADVVARIDELMAQLPAPAGAGEPEAASGEVVGPLLLAWASGERPPFAMEGATPRLAEALGTTAPALSFDDFTYGSPREGWELRPVELSGDLGAPLGIYAPASWEVLPADGVPGAGLVDAAGATRVSVGLLPRRKWAELLPAWLDRARIGGWTYFQRAEGYDQWVVVMEPGEAVTWWVWGLFGGGDAVVIVKGDAADADALRDLLAVVMNSNPWIAWIAADRPRNE